MGKITVSDQHIGKVSPICGAATIGELYHAYSLWSLVTIHDLTWH